MRSTSGVSCKTCWQTRCESSPVPAGRVTVTIGASPAGAPIVDVSDTGPGVPAELRERLFERFASFRPEGQHGVGYRARARA